MRVGLPKIVQSFPAESDLARDDVQSGSSVIVNLLDVMNRL